MHFGTRTVPGPPTDGSRRSRPRSVWFGHRISNGFQESEFPIAKNLAAEVLSLPMGPHLTLKQQDTVIDILLKLLKL